MVNILLILGLTGTVIITVERDRKKKEEINELKGIVVQNKKDIEAIANAINVYSTSISGSVEQKVKKNVDLFSEWLNGETDV